MRVYELAKEYGMKSVDLVSKSRQDWKLPVRSYMDVLSADLEKALRKRLDKAKDEVPVKVKKTKTLKRVVKKATPSSKPKKEATAVKIKKPVVKKTKAKTTIKKSAEPALAPEAPKPSKTSNVIRRKAVDVKPIKKADDPSQIPKLSILPEADKEESDTKTVGNLKEDLLSSLSQDSLPEDEKKKTKKVSEKESNVKKFVASDFRKREVIFQPKKKRIVQDRSSKKTQVTVPKSHKRVIKYHGTLSVQELSHQMGIKVNKLIDKLKTEGLPSEPKDMLDFDTVTLVAVDFNFEVKNQEQTFAEFMEEQKHGNLTAEPITCPPVVTVMGHVDHGKTTLLDKIRKSQVVESEAGGITQHVGAYSVPVGNSFVTFIDTPGHEAFSEMRARGAKLTNIIIIVVAADDGVSAQTKEAIKHAQSAKVPILVAVNKMDKPGADVEKVKKQMSEQGLLAEDWGGDIIFVPISALKGDGLKELLEQVLLIAEMQELKANPKQSAQGIVIESRMEKGRGWVSTLIIQNGTLKSSQYIMTESIIGRVRQMQDDKGKSVKEAPPGHPVEVSGFDEPPVVGEIFCAISSEKKAKDFLDQYKSRPKAPEPAKTLEELIADHMDTKKTLNLVIKADVAGSLEAIKSSIAKLESEEININVIDSGLGPVSDSDVLLASTSKAELIAFNVRFDSKTEKLSKDHNTPIWTYTIIYELLDGIKKRAIGSLDPDIVEEKGGSAEIREVFTITGLGAIGGSMVTDGKILRTHLARLVRDGVVVHDGKISSLRRFKDDVKEVAEKFECGIGLENYNDIKPGDLIETYIKKEVPKTEL